MMWKSTGPPDVVGNVLRLIVDLTGSFVTGERTPQLACSTNCDAARPYGCDRVDECITTCGTHLVEPGLTEGASGEALAAAGITHFGLELVGVRAASEGGDHQRFFQSGGGETDAVRHSATS